MTIRRTLLAAFLALTLISATVLTALAFFQARQALQQEITRNLSAQAVALMEQIDRLMLERLENIHTWSHLEIMQEIRIRDIDKRLSRFLLSMKTHFGIYARLYAAGMDGKAVASSLPELVGQGVPAEQGESLELPDGLVYIHPLVFGLAPVLPIRAPVDDAFGQGLVGHLYVEYDWQDLLRLLDRLAEPSGQMILLLGQDGQVLAASASLRQRGLLGQYLPPAWLALGDADAGVEDDAEGVLGAGPVLLGHAHSNARPGFRGMGWSLLVAQSQSSAFEPVERMRWTFFLLLLATAVVAVLLAYRVAGRIARPIVQLTRFTRRFRDSQSSADIPAAGPGEVGELTLAFVQMIEALQQSRQNLVRAAKLATVGEMAAIMAHEVRTPLGILRSSAQMLKREPQLSAEGREMLDFIVGESDRLNQLVSTLLDAARPRAPQFRSHDLHAIAKRGVELLGHQAQKKNIRLELDWAAGDGQMACDDDQLLQVLLNLVMNAIQHTPAGGTVRVVGWEESGERLALAVDDSGPGVPAEQRQQVFDPFFTRREGGIGLGLAVVQQIVASHQGRIAVADSPLGGARFHLSLPRFHTEAIHHD